MHSLALALMVLTVLFGAIGRRRRRQSLRYGIYLRSPLWRLRRRVWILQAGGRCENCGRWWGRRLTIHRVNYKRLGHERRSDIRVLCWPCHRACHRHRAGATRNRRDTVGQPEAPWL
jgi:hypothetical protein